MRKSLAAAAAIAALTAFAPPASAAVNLYQFNLDGTTGSSLTNGPWGTVSVDDHGGTSHFSFDVLLGTGPTDTNNVYFNDSKAFHAFDYLLSGTVTNVTGITAGFTYNGLGSYSAPNIIVPSDSTKFNYSFDCASICAGGKVDDLVRELKFDVFGTNLDLLGISDAKNYPGKTIFFSADIAQNGNTGNIGATLIGGVPEPATWALFILGFGFIGGTLRMQRARQGASLTA
jgi:hypothetical protein